MLNKYAFIFCAIDVQIRAMSDYLVAEKLKLPQAAKVKLTNVPESGFGFALTALKNQLKFIHLPSVLAQISRIEDMNKRENTNPDELLTAIQELRRRLQDDLESRSFLYVPDDRVPYYADSATLFGNDVINRFPEVLDDVEGAGHCLALGEGTACVLHLMRVMEVGLKKLSDSLGIPHAPSWESHLTQIQKKIAEKNHDKTDEWKGVEMFYRDLSGDLVTVKQAWRNPTMHVGRKYGADEAEEIFRAVRSFMKKLAKDLPTKSSSVVQFSSMPC